MISYMPHMKKGMPRERGRAWEREGRREWGEEEWEEKILEDKTWMKDTYNNLAIVKRNMWT